MFIFQQSMQRKRNDFEQLPNLGSKTTAKTLEISLSNPNFEHTHLIFLETIDSFRKIFESRGVHPKLREYFAKLDSNSITSIKTSSDENQNGVITLSAKISRIGSESDEIIQLISPGRTSLSIWTGDNGLFANIERNKKTVTVQYG